MVRFGHSLLQMLRPGVEVKTMTCTLNRLRTIPTWIAVLTGGSLLVILYFIVQGALAHALMYSLIGLSSATLILIRARTMSSGRTPWLLMGSMQLLWAVGDLVWLGYEHVLHQPAPYPSIADVFYLAAYPVAMVGFVLFMRRRAGRQTAIVFKDALIVALLVGLSAWQLVVQPYLQASGLLSSGDIVGISYPIMDVLLLAATAALFVGPGANSPSNRLLVIGVTSVLFGDGMYSFGWLNGSYYTGIWYDAAFLLGYVLFAAAASHPAADALEKDRSVESLGRHFRLLFVVGSATTAILAFEYFRGAHISPLPLVTVGGGSFLLAVARIGALYRHSQIQIKAATESEGRYRSLLDHASDAIFIVENGRYVDVNDRASELIGYARADLLAAPVESLTPQHEKELAAEGLERARAGETVIQERHLIHKDGSQILVEASGRILPDGRYQSIVRDIQDRRAAEEALRRNEELLRKVFDSGISGMALASMDWRLLQVNSTFATMLGYEPGEMEGFSLRDLTHPDERDTSLDGIAALVEGATEEVKLEKRYQHRAGHWVWTNVSLMIAHDKDGTNFTVAHVLDISHSKALEESLRQGQMMEAVGQLAGGVAHDFNNLLSVIQNFTRFVYETMDPTDPNRKDLEEVLKAGDRGAGLVRQLLTMARRERSATEIVDVNELLSDMSVLLRRTVRQSISLDVQLSPYGPHVEMDRSQLEQILLNLTVNASDAMPGGGELILRTEVVKLSPEESDLAQVTPGEYVRVRAHDTGTGMSPEVRLRIFEPFFSTKERGAGTGLGLATVYGIVTRGGGGITVDSEIDQGTTFDVFLPVVGRGREEAIHPSSRISLKGHDACVLVVDDEDGVRAIVQRILESNGYRVLSASNLSEALEISDKGGSPIRAVVTDVVMPNGSGFELVEQLRLQRPGLPALYISGYSGDVLTAHGLVGGDRYVSKPFKPDEILSALSAVIEHEFAA